MLCLMRPCEAKALYLVGLSPPQNLHLQRSGAQAKVRYVFQPEAKVPTPPGRETPHLTQSSALAKSPGSRPFR